MHTPGNLYADLASYYDQFCNEVDYTEQCEFAARAFDCFACSGGRDYLDLACGTGKQDSSQGRQSWRDHHTMTALTLPQLSTMLESTGFEVTLLEHDYRVMPWDEKSYNAIVIAAKAQPLRLPPPPIRDELGSR